MGKFSKYLDDSTEQNMRTIARTAQTGSMTDKVANKHTQLSKIFKIDKSVDSNKESAS